jgi:YVTN family beta-propeller protein
VKSPGTHKHLSCPLRVHAILAVVAICALAFAASASAELVIKRDGGKRLRFGGPVRVWCGPWDDTVARPSVHVLVGHPRRHWEMSAVSGDVKLGRSMKFPRSVLADDPHGAELFVGVAGRPPIEASSSEEEASGSIAFSQLDCALGGMVEFRVKANLGSELFGGERVRVSGSFRGQVGEPPGVASRAKDFISGRNPSAIALSPDGARAYVTNSDSGTVSVIDTATKKVVGRKVHVGNLPIAIAISPDGRRAYVANLLDNSISVIDTATKRLLGRPLRVGTLPTAIAIAPDGRRAYVTNAYDNTVSVLDLTGGTPRVLH